MFTRTETTLPGVCLLEPGVFGDRRGFFMETYNRRDFAAAGIACAFVQDNHTLSTRHVLRGLHYQLRQPQAKLLRVIRGEMFDVAVDIRRGSPCFGCWAGARLSAENRRMMYVPAGFAHGFCVLSDEAEVLYKCSDFYAPADERGVAWNDPRIDVAWPLAGGAAPTLSDRDRALPLLAAVPPWDLPAFTEQA